MIKSNQPDSKSCQSGATTNKYEHHWPQIQPVIRSLINNQPISIEEWQNVFHHVHMICLWDTNGAFKLLKALEIELKERVIRVVKARLRSIEDGRQQLKEYVEAWLSYCQHCDRLPMAFQQLDLATRNVSVKMRWPDKNHVGTYPSKKINGSTVRTLMMKTWDRHITAPLEDRLRKSAIELVMEDRQGLLVDTKLIVELRKSFQDLQFCTANNLPANTYLKSFEASYIESIVMFYQSRADEYYENNGLIDYIEWALSNVDQENKRARMYLSSETNAIQYVDEACSRILVANFASHAVLECSDYINRIDLKNMQLIFKFLKRSTRESILDFLEEFRSAIIVNCLSNLISPEWLIASNCEKFTELALRLYNQFHSVVTSYMDNDPQASEALEKAFSEVINDKRIFAAPETFGGAKTSPSKGQSSSLRPTIPPESKCADLLANYCDMLLRRTNLSKKLSRDNIANRLNQVLFMVRFLKNKDTFIKFYRQHLIRRLILETTTDFAKEQEFVLSLREVPEMPLEKITNLLRLFKDYKTSEDLYQKFKMSLQNDGTVGNNNNNEVLTSALIQSNIENTNTMSQENKYISLRKRTESIRVKVLNPNAWTKINEEEQSINLPVEVSAMAPEFELFYGQQYEGRRLIWCPQLSNGVVSFTTTKGKYDLEISAAQLSILSAFGDRSRKGINIIGLEKATGLSLAELRRNLWSLVLNPKLPCGILDCYPPVTCMKDLENDTNVYSVNHDFGLMKNDKPISKGRISLIGRLQT